MSEPDEEGEDRMLAEALVKARNLVCALEEQKAEIDQSPPKDIEPKKLAEGKMAFDNALAAARRMLKALEEAVVIRISEDIDHHDN